ncbi:secretion/conjugation apparatus DotM-related subunit [Azohydromonas australica]|uniref:secretion/conjugation apparatus DotM-related subunit n=1 Tax=Azohydromonas australica TaxID=364039 RepID=UPI00048C2EA2|nr:hypothetical protein [Azohydromonas australica]
MRSNAHRTDDMGFVCLAAAALVAALLWFLWYQYHVEISYYALLWTWKLLGFLEWPWMPDAIRSWRAQAVSLAAMPQRLSLPQLLDVMNTAGYFFVLIPIALTLRAVVLATRHRANLTCRRIDASTLPWIMAKHAPAVIPTLYYGDKQTLLLNVDPKEHRSALNPEEWVAEHALLIDGMLDRARCRELLAANLGTPVTDLAELQPHERALFAVFGARLLSNGKDGAAAQELLDALNRSCHAGTLKGQRGYPDLALAQPAFERYAQHPEAAQWLARHPYPKTLLHSMHKQVMLSGALPSSHFRWLKGMDRGLWYALNTTGRKTPFIESAAVFTQALWEDFAQDCGYALTEPFVDDAIDGVEKYLIRIGLMRPRKD